MNNGEVKHFSRSGPELNRLIEQYYEEAAIDYRLLWHNQHNLAFHFGYYDSETRTHAESLENTNRILAMKAGVQRGDRVLDAGCGIGGSCLWLAKNLGARATGVALGGQAIEQARIVARECGLDDLVQFDCGDFKALAYEDAFFDVVWALESVCHLPKKSEFYREASRLLRPGGRLVVGEFMRSERDLSEQDERVMDEWMSGWVMPGIDTARQHLEGAELAGLAQARVDDITPQMFRSFRRLYRCAIVANPVNCLLHRVGLRNAVQYNNVIASLRQFQALRNGCWFYGVLTATKP
jgi:tocopherol O-methyltransferase